MIFNTAMPNAVGEFLRFCSYSPDTRGLNSDCGDICLWVTRALLILKLKNQGTVR